MINVTQLDVLIVYTETLASSATNDTESNGMPFLAGSKNESYNVVYGYFLEICKKHSLKAGLTTSADIIGAGYCRSYWTHRNKKWIKNDTPCFSSLIFDKFAPTRK